MLYELLQTACAEGAWGTVDFLLKEMDFNVDGRKRDGSLIPSFIGTPLRLAVGNRHPDVVEVLLYHGANPNLQDDNGCLPLPLSCRHEDDTIAGLLLDYGADIDAIEEGTGQAAIHRAVKIGNPKVVTLLCRRGANLDLTYSPLDRSEERKTALMLAVGKCASDGDYEIVKILLDSGANVNATNELGKTPLMYAVESGCPKTVEILLAYGANPWMKDNSGETALNKTEDKHIHLRLYNCRLYNKPDDEDIY